MTKWNNSSSKHFSTYATEKAWRMAHASGEVREEKEEEGEKNRERETEWRPRDEKDRMPSAFTRRTRIGERGTN